MKTTYVPKPESLAHKVCSYFVRLPDEELLSREIAANFNVSPDNIAAQLSLAVEAAYLTRDGSVYSAGSDLKTFEAALLSGDKPAASSGFHRWLERKGETSAEGRPSRAPKADAGTPPPAPRETPRKSPGAAFRMDLSAITIDKGIPMPAGKTAVVDWPALLNRMDVGDSILLPAEARSAIGSAATKFKKSTGRVLSIRTVADGVRVWRTS